MYDSLFCSYLVDWLIFVKLVENNAICLYAKPLMDVQRLISGVSLTYWYITNCHYLHVSASLMILCGDICNVIPSFWHLNTSEKRREKVKGKKEKTEN